MQVVYLLEKTIEITLLFDYYGELLTERQQKAFRLYYFQDLSLAEIAEQIKISRQGVYDHLHRAEKLLHSYEKKLGLIKMLNILKEDLNNINNFVENDLSLKVENEKKLQNKIEEIRKHLLD